MQKAYLASKKFPLQIWNILFAMPSTRASSSTVGRAVIYGLATSRLPFSQVSNSRWCSAAIGLVPRRFEPSKAT